MEYIVLKRGRNTGNLIEQNRIHIQIQVEVANRRRKKIKRIVPDTALQIVKGTENK